MSRLGTRVLVTGAAGALGRAVVRHLQDEGVAVTGLDRLEPREVSLERLVIGSAADPEAVRDAAAGVDAVVHLAALREPSLGTAEEVFCGNTNATFTVLEQAGQAGIRRAVIASSYALTGLPFARQERHPPYLPIDEAIPPQIEDPYALSKQVDELSAAMMWWRHGLSVCALRFPYLGAMDSELSARAELLTRDPAMGASELWTYLDMRDAAAACVAGLVPAEEGCHVVGLAAPNTLVPYPTSRLLDIFHPHTPRRTVFHGTQAPISTWKARALLRWEARHLWRVEPRELDEAWLASGAR